MKSLRVAGDDLIESRKINLTQGAYLHRDGETIAVRIGEEFKLRVPVHTLEGLVSGDRLPAVLGCLACVVSAVCWPGERVAPRVGGVD